MSYQGYIDSIRGRAIKGWAYNSADPGERVRLRILCDGRQVGETDASIYRGDLESAGIGDGHHAFEFALDPSLPATAAFAVEVPASGYQLVDTTARQRQRGMEAFQHSHIDGLPPMEHGFSEASVGALDVEIARRMIEAWRGIGALHAGPFVGAGNMWALHGDDKQRPFVGLLHGGDARQLAEYCITLPRQAITHGLFQGDEHTRTLEAATADHLNLEASRYWDSLLSLGEYLGVRGCECPEQGEWGRALLDSRVEIRQRIEAALGVPLVPPQAFQGLFGMRFTDGIVHRRDVQGCYAAHRLKEIAASPAAAVLEVGGGMGGAAYYARRMGLRDYTIVDLPAIAMLQLYYLSKAFGPDEVVFVESAADFRHDGRIHLVPAALFADRAVGGFDLAFNMDSFPEMGREVAGNYLREFERKGIAGLFSINQEAGAPLTNDARGERQPYVRDLARETRYRAVLRYPDWVHKGYVDELFTLGEAR